MIDMLEAMGDSCRHEAVASTPLMYIFLKEEATPYLSSVLARPKFTFEKAVLDKSVGIQEDVRGSPDNRSFPPFLQIVRPWRIELSPLARKPDPEDEGIGEVLPRSDHLHRLNPRQEIRESPRGLHHCDHRRPLRLRILVVGPSVII
jgi:hypothetical protein